MSGRRSERGPARVWAAGRPGSPSAVGLALLIALCSLPAPGLAQADAKVVTDTFPHIRHSGLFPLCAGCHTGISEGDAATAYPDPASCNGCHNGIDQPRVDWTPRPKPAALLDFSHPAHAVAVAEDPGSDRELDCGSCHLAPGGARLEVVPLQAGSCLSCHLGVEPEDHLTPMADCASCHRPVSESETGEAFIARLAGAPEALLPADHRREDFLATHAPTADEGATRCATCHVQERCASCHVDLDRPGVQRVPRAPRTWALPEMSAAYPTPVSHLDEGFAEAHGRPTPALQECSTCHTRSDCLTCHIQPVPPVIDSLVRVGSGLPGGHVGLAAPPSRGAEISPASGAPGPDTLEQERRVQAPGVGLEYPSPTSHASPFFMTAHPLLAGGSPGQCSSCHEQSFCTDCHEQPGETGFHPGGFVLRHAPAASSVFQDCASCHSTERFCRECHVAMGRGSVGRLGPGFHDAEPLFLLRHGTAARRDLSACASCHTQNDCRQCHSETGAFQVNPHGPGFDAASAQAANPFICAACHIGPIGERIGGGGGDP